MLDTQQIIHMLSSLAGIVVLIVITAFIIKKFSRFTNKNNGSLNIISSLSLGTKEKLVVVEVANKQLLLGVTNQSIQTLHVLDEPIKPNTSPIGKRSSEAKA